MTSERIQRRIERLLDQVEEAANQEKWEAVCRLSRQILVLDSDNADARTNVSPRSCSTLCLIRAAA